MRSPPRSHGFTALALALLLAGGAAAQPELGRLPRPKPIAADAEQVAVPPNAAAGGIAVDGSRPSLALAARLPRPRPGMVQEAAVSAAVERNGGDVHPRVAYSPEATPDPPQPLAQAAGNLPAAALDGLARLPKPRPSAPAALASMEPDTQEAVVAMLPAAPVDVGGDVSACLKRLKNLGVEFTRLPPIARGSACHVEAPLEVTSLGSGVEIAPQAVLNCRTTEGLALWVRDSVVPAAKKHLAAAPNQIIHDSAYVCRNRNNAPGGRISEHATANAVDIASIGFAGRPPVAIGGGRGGAEAQFEAAVRRDSCAYFTTVLGPGSNAAHATHFHFDAAERRGGYRLCDLGPRIAAGGS